MTESLVHSNFYQTPAERVLQSRKTFYLTQKQHTESIADWLWRIRECINNCDFGELNDFLLIDKFIGELGNDEVQSFRNVQAWKLDQLYETVLNHSKQYSENGTLELCRDQNTSINEILRVELNEVWILLSIS